MPNHSETVVSFDYIKKEILLLGVFPCFRLLCFFLVTSGTGSVAVIVVIVFVRLFLVVYGQLCGDQWHYFKTCIHREDKRQFLNVWFGNLRRTGNCYNPPRDLSDLVSCCQLEYTGLGRVSSATSQ